MACALARGKCAFAARCCRGALEQLWLFWLAPLAGGAAGGILYRWLSEASSAPQSAGAPVASPLAIASVDR